MTDPHPGKIRPVTRAPERRRPESAPTGDGSALFDGYLEPDRPYAGAFDEMFHADGRVRSHYRALHDAIAPTAAADLAVRSEALDRAYVDQGITFSLSGQERPFPLDIVLTDADAMAEGRTVSTAKQLTIVARFSKSGMPTASSGDLYGEVRYDPASGRPVELTIDKTVP